MQKLSREQIIEIIKRLQACDYKTEEEADRALAELKNGVADPNISDYIFFEDLTAEEAADKALSYRPVLL